ncbi:MAG: hypothetical protein ABH896_04315 [Candidatus Jacksonbacteria bacterium]
MITAACLISWFLWSLVFIFIAPQELGVFGVILFLIALGAAFFTSFLLFFYYIRIKLLDLSPAFRQFHIIFRESFLLSSFLIIALVLTHFKIASLLNVLLLVVLILIIDIFCIINYDKRRPQKIK